MWQKLGNMLLFSGRTVYWGAIAAVVVVAWCMIVLIIGEAVVNGSAYE